MAEDLSKALSDFVESALHMCNVIRETVVDSFAGFNGWIKGFLPTLAAYQAAEREHPRWVHLAHHAKRGRTRKKYHNRIMREYGGESNEQT